MTLNKNDMGEDKRSCSVWDTDSSNGVTFKHVMWPSVWTLSVRGSALGPVPFPVRNTGKQLRKHEAKSKHGPETEKSRPDCLVAHSNETWCHRQLKLNLRVGGQSWSLPRITGGRWDCEREEYSLQGKSYLARVAVGLEPGTCRGVWWPARVNQNKSYPPPLLTEPLSQSVSRIWLRESLVKPIRSNNPALVEWGAQLSLSSGALKHFSLYRPHNSSRAFVSQGKVCEPTGEKHSISYQV